MGTSQQISKGHRRSESLSHCTVTLIRTKPTLTRFPSTYAAVRRKTFEKGLPRYFFATELSHYVAAALINFTQLSTPSPSNNSPLLFGSHFLISDSWGSHTVGQCCEYNCIRIHPESNKRSTMKPLFGVFQHYILKKTPNHPHEVVRKGQAHGCRGGSSPTDSGRAAALSLMITSHWGLSAGLGCSSPLCRWGPTMHYEEKLGLTHAVISPIHLHVVWRANTGVVANGVVTCPWTTDSRSFTFIHIYNPKRKW